MTSSSKKKCTKLDWDKIWLVVRDYPHFHHLMSPSDSLAEDFASSGITIDQDDSKTMLREENIKLYETEIADLQNDKLSPKLLKFFIEQAMSLFSLAPQYLDKAFLMYPYKDEYSDNLKKLTSGLNYLMKFCDGTYTFPVLLRSGKAIMGSREAKNIVERFKFLVDLLKVNTPKARKGPKEDCFKKSALLDLFLLLRFVGKLNSTKSIYKISSFMKIFGFADSQRDPSHLKQIIDRTGRSFIENYCNK